MQKLKILHNVNTIGKSSFGLGQISVSLARTQYQLGHDVAMWCLDSAENILWASETHVFSAERIRGFKLFGPQTFLFSSEMIKHARINTQSTFDIVHQHGIWTGVSISTLIFSRKKIIPTIIAPHGSLNQWALNRSRWRKKIAFTAYENENLRRASCLHATSEIEISDFRNFGLHNPIAYIENGIQEKYLTLQGNAKRFREQHNIATDKRILLFLSRISPKKGLKMLVEAIKSIQDDFTDWQLIIAGIDQLKDDAFAAAELFILPSYSEGSPMVVLDSLAAGVPVITTKASTWSDLVEYDCGWWTDINTPAIAAALREAVNMSVDDLHHMGKQGKKLITSKYTWPQLANKTIRLYEWLLGYNDKPDFVVLD